MGLLDVTSELQSLRRLHLVREQLAAARGEAAVERGGEQGAGTPSSIAAMDVHRPSPESETRPANCSSPGSARSASAVRSSSHERDDAAPPPHLGDLGEVDSYG